MKFSMKITILVSLLCVLSVVVLLRTVVTHEEQTVEPEVITESAELSDPSMPVVEEVVDTEVVDTAAMPIVEEVVEIPSTPVVEEVVETPSYTEEELEVLAIIIYQEAGADACSDDTRMKVGNVFLNRVDSPLFPDTFEEVALQEWQYGTLSQTGLKWPDRASQDVERHAVARAYEIAERCLEEDRILPSNVVFQAEFEQGDGTYCYQDGLYFCYIN